MTQFLGKLEALEQLELIKEQKEKSRLETTNTELLRFGATDNSIDASNSSFFKSKGDISKQKFSSVGTYDTQLIEHNNSIGATNTTGTNRYDPFAFTQNTSGNSVMGYKQTEENLVETGPSQSQNVSQTNTVNSTLSYSNQLHDYAPVNYIISLSCLSKEKFNNGIGSESLILKSGGKGKQGTGNLNKDFYIENLVVRNTVAPGEQSGTGSIFQIIFDVVEPFGTSFVDALIQAAGEMRYSSHLQAVYNLKIEFKGNDDEGNPTNFIPFTTRNIPVHIYQVEFKIEAGVSTYQLQCVPATHLAQTDIYSYVQESVTCTGDTVGDIIEDFFRNYSQSLKTQSSSTNLKVNLTDEYVLDRSQSMEKILKSEIGYSSSSALSKIVTVSNIFDTATSSNFRSITVPKGTKIQTFLDAVIKESRYYKDQLNTDGSIKNDEFFVHKIETQLNIGPDNGNGRDQYIFVYIIREQGFTAEFFDPTKDTSKKIQPVRIYDYIYTGKNKDVLDFDISYKFSYYQTIPYLQDKGNQVVTEAGDGNEKQNLVDGDKTIGSSNEGVANEVLNQSASSFIPDVNDENDEIVDIMLQHIQNPTADLLVTNLEIIGDPYWISQKGVTNSSFANSFTALPNVDSVGAVASDESQIVVQINFKTPSDLDDETGLFKNIQDAQGFAGKYRVYMCEHRLAGGMYTTVLQMIRMKNQPKTMPNQIGQSANSLGAGTYTYEPSTTIGQSANAMGESYYSYNPPSTVGESANSIGPDSYVTGVTTNNVTRVPIGSNIAGGKPRGFAPEGFSDDFLSNLPLPKIEITGSYYSQAETQARLVKQAQGKRSRIRGGI